MTADKRTPHTDALDTLGQTIGPDEKRDAIHLAVEPIEAAHRMMPGEDVGLLPDGRASKQAEKKLGIVDPFLTGPVLPGERFWLVVYPRQIKSLRHVWEHPDFPSETVDAVDDSKQASIAWIEDYVHRINHENGDYCDDVLEYDDLMTYAATWCENVGKWGGDYLSRGGLLEGVHVSPEFWLHFTNVTGKVPVDGPETQFFSCSC